MLNPGGFLFSRRRLLVSAFRLLLFTVPNYCSKGMYGKRVASSYHTVLKPIVMVISGLILLSMLLIGGLYTSEEVRQARKPSIVKGELAPSAHISNC